jgi:hypothetical protein
MGNIDHEIHPCDKPHLFLSDVRNTCPKDLCVLDLGMNNHVVSHHRILSEAGYEGRKNGIPCALSVCK